MKNKLITDEKQFEREVKLFLKLFKIDWTKFEICYVTEILTVERYVGTGGVEYAKVRFSRKQIQNYIKNINKYRIKYSL
jgi:hypothetical protein